MASITEITVRYAETDAMGVVHHAVYPIWFEIARTDYIKAVGLSYAEMEKGGVMLPVTSISVKYRISLSSYSLLELKTRLFSDYITLSVILQTFFVKTVDRRSKT